MSYQNPGAALFAALYEKDNYMSSIWLTPESEGRFSFTTAGGETLPVTVVAENGKWIAVAENGGLFYSNHSSTLELTEDLYTVLQFPDRSFFLYTERSTEKDNVFIPYYITPYSVIKIGRRQESDICYSPNSFVSRDHAELRYDNGEWYVSDSDSQLGVFVNGKSIKEHKLVPGDVIMILRLCIIFGVGYIAVNNAEDRARIVSRNIRLVNGRYDLDFGRAETAEYGKFFDRSPRRKYPIPANTIEIELPPPSMSSGGVPFLLRMGNSLISGGRAVMSGNPLSLVSSTVLPFITQGISEKDRKEYEQLRKEKYNEYIVYTENVIASEIAEEKDRLEKSYPSLESILKFTEDSERLWERRKSDDDFLTVRLGVGSIPMMAEVHYPKRKFELEKDPLIDEMYALAEKPHLIEDAPILVSLKDNIVTSVVGAREGSLELVRNVITRIALTHAYDELKIVVLAGDGDDVEDALGFAKYLPHCWNNEKSLRLYAKDTSDVQQLSKYLITEWEQVFPQGPKTEASAKPKNVPAYLVIVADKYLFDSMEIIQKASALEAYAGISLLTVFGSAPKECAKLISMGEGGVLQDFADPTSQTLTFAPDRLSEGGRALFDKSVATLYGTKLALGAEQYNLPKSISFLEMYGVGKVEYLQPLQRWADNNPIKSLAAPIGIGTDGKLMTLDLHEKRQGPHGLIAGGTGSGKSEFIITYILSMAINYSPDEVAFVLIDYKGGGLADAFVDAKRGIHLPHVVATITNLDGAAIQRSLLSIQSELKRRQEIFKKAKSEAGEGTMDIYDYQRLYRAHTVSEPLPHLFIIADEFAELKKQEPEFMDELISIARIGRSLGVHLILATQKPSGVVNDQIWSNTKFRVCLRVATRSDSVEMLKRGEAAELKNVGRYYLQVGFNEYFALGQSGWCGADYVPSDVVEEKKDTSVQFIDNVGQVVLESKPKVTTVRKSEGKQIVAIVRYISDLARREGIKPRKLWKDPLAKNIDLSGLSLPEEKDGDRKNGSMKALLGMVDDPSHQKQFPYVLDMMSFHHAMVVGPSGSGKSTFIKTMLTSLISRHSPSELSYYLADFSGGALKQFSKTSHCGAYITENEAGDLNRLLTQIREIVAQRKKVFAEAEVSNFDTYRKIAPMTTILVIIDSCGVIATHSETLSLHTELGNYMKDCASYGIKFIMTANHLNELHTRSRQEIDYKVGLMAKDQYEYSDILDKKCKITAPLVAGRGVTFIDDVAYEIHIASQDVGFDEEERIERLKARIAQIRDSYPEGCGAPLLPTSEKGETYAEFLKGFRKGRIPLGYSLKDMKQIVLPLRQFDSASIYFGNPFGVPYVISNLLSAAEFNGMDVIFVKRNGESVANRPEIAEQLSGYRGKVSFFDSTEDGYARLFRFVMDEVIRRSAYRDQYCAEHSIPPTDKTRTPRSAAFIKANTVPTLILFESLVDLVSLERTDDVKQLDENFVVFFKTLNWFGFYMAACFYPEDDKTAAGSKLVQAFNPGKFAMLFGGKFDKQNVLPTFPMEYRRITNVVKEYDRFYMNYQDNVYAMRMPCGEIVERQMDPDDEPIV